MPQIINIIIRPMADSFHFIRHFQLATLSVVVISTLPYIRVNISLTQIREARPWWNATVA